MKNELCLIKKISKKNVGFCLLPTVLLMGLTFVMGFYYDGNVMKKLGDVTVELGDVVPLEISNYVGMISNQSNLVIEDNVPKDSEGHTTMIGEFNYYLVYNDDTYKFSRLTNAKATIKVVDTVSPVITLKEKREIKYGSNLNATDIAECFDLSGCKMYFKEEIDTSKSGNYEVTIIGIDAAKNTSTYEEVTITVLEKPKPVVNYNYGSSFSAMNNKNNELNSKLSEEEKNSLRYQVVEFAKQFIGNPYVYGGTSLTNGTDCSGFTMSIYANFGYSLPRVSTSQNYIGIPVSAGNLLPGDIVVYHYDGGGGHVGIYVGNGMMVHAATSQTGIVLAPMFSGYRTYRRIIY